MKRLVLLLVFISFLSPVLVAQTGNSFSQSTLFDSSAPTSSGGFGGPAFQTADLAGEKRSLWGGRGAG